MEDKKAFFADSKIDISHFHAFFSVIVTLLC